MASAEVLDAPDGSALTWILDHCLRYPGSYEIPLRSMYAFNCTSMRQSPSSSRFPETPYAHRPSNSFGKSQDASPESSTDLQTQLAHHLSRLPSQPCTLPASFLTNFIRRCFTPELENVDFPQALSALDYLKDLDNRRKKEVNAALERLHVGPEDLQQSSELARKYPGVLSWIQAIGAKGRMVDALYTQIYTGLRRWTLINEMMLEPFNKGGCIAMLNTLFPPVADTSAPPAPNLTPQILKSQRDGYFRYIKGVETNGTAILHQLTTQGAPEGSDNSWPLVRDSLDKYLRNVTDIIDECAMVNGPACLDEGIGSSSSHSPKTRKADSGISFGSHERLPTPPHHHQGAGAQITEESAEKPLPPFPAEIKAGGSTLERLARELRRLGLNTSGKKKELKTKKSSVGLAQRPETQNAAAAAAPGGHFFDIDEQKRQRLIAEANSRKSGHSSASHSKASSFDSLKSR